jgi:hypothetical protein
MGDVPEFAAFYQGESGLTPLMAYDLWVACDTLYGNWGPFGNRNDREWLASQLPTAVAQHVDQAWLDRFQQCFLDLKHRLAIADIDPFKGIARCTGEEFAVYLAAIEVEVFRETESDNPLQDGSDTDPVRAALPVRDTDLVWADDFCRGVQEILLSDTDVMLLLDPGLDGIEDGIDLGELGNLSDAANLAGLRWNEWFEPFSY